MGMHSTRGFTIIETMLVLAVTAMLLAGLFIGVGSAISTQRYRDSVVSFQAELQDQYSLTQNVSNDREGVWNCAEDATPTQAESGTGSNLGQTDCVILGRYIAVNGETIGTGTIIGYGDSGDASANDVEVLGGYRLNIADTSVESSQLSWGSRIAHLGQSAAQGFSMMVLRSPVSGTMFTFTSRDGIMPANMTPERLSSMVAAGAPTERQALCIAPTGFYVPERMAVTVNVGVNSAAGIETMSPGTLRATGETRTC